MRKIFFLLVIFSIGMSPLVFSDSVEDLQIKKHYRLGQIYYEHGLYEEAEAEFQQAIKIAGEGKTTKDREILTFKPQEEGASTQGEYVITVGDELAIKVWENPDLNQSVIVRPDGKIAFPLIDEVQAAGFTFKQLDSNMTDALTSYIRQPDVSISLISMGGERVIILGQVNGPGIIELKGRKTVSEAIALAGGFTPEAVLNSVVVIKGGINDTKVMRANLSKVLLQGDRENDIALVAQDIVYVPKKFILNIKDFAEQMMDIVSKGHGIIDTVRIGWSDDPGK